MYICTGKNKLMKFKINLLVVVVLSTILGSCGTMKNNVSYFQDMTPDNDLLDGVESNYEVKITSDDLLAISVSSIDPNAIAVFNLPATTFLQPGVDEIYATPVLQSYLVDSEGCINFPVLGKLHVAGMTRNSLADYLKKRIAQYAKDPIISVNIMNFKVSVLGEVMRPGTIQITNERISILDAISMAGDLTINGMRDRVTLIRDENGKKTYHVFDLTSSEIFKSPYFYLKQNDIIYVEPNKARRSNANYSQSAQFNISVASTVVSAISVLASLCIALFVNR